MTTMPAGQREIVELPSQTQVIVEQTAEPSSQTPSRAIPAETPTSIPTFVPPPTITAPPTAEANFPATSAPTRTITPSPSPSLTPTFESSPTTSPDRICPETPPLKPVYDRFFLSPRIWPMPNTDIAATHFWLSKPLPGAGRMLINQRYPYGWDDNGRLLLHNGLDTAEDLGTPVLAVADGKIVVAQSDQNAWYGWRCDWYGHLVVIELEDTWQEQPIYALYGHVLNINVKVGDHVKRGDQVAEIGFGGAALNPHLHFELRVGENEFGATRNPMLWIDPGPTRGVVAGRLVDPEGRPWQGVPLLLFNPESETEKLTTWSYLGDPDQLSNPDEGWAENFVFSDVPPGNYEVFTNIQDVEYRQALSVSTGAVTFVEIQTEPYQALTATPGSP